MRMDQRNSQTAADIVNTYSESDLYQMCIRDSTNIMRVIVVD